MYTYAWIRARARFFSSSLVDSRRVNADSRRLYLAREIGLRRECAMIRAKMLKRAAPRSPLSLFPFPSFPSLALAPSRLLFSVSFAAKTNATYLSADTAGLPSSAPPSLLRSSAVFSSQRAALCVLGVYHPLAGSEDLVRRESAAACAGESIFFFFILSLASSCRDTLTLYLGISHARLFFAKSSSRTRVALSNPCKTHRKRVQFVWLSLTILFRSAKRNDEASRRN